MLKSLPQSIGNLQNLHILNLSYNILLYLPISMFWLKEVEHLDITMNSFRIQKYEQNNEQNNVRVQSLVILSANIVLQHRFVASSKLFLITHTHARTQNVFFFHLSYYRTFCLNKS